MRFNWVENGPHEHLCVFGGRVVGKVIRHGNGNITGLIGHTGNLTKVVDECDEEFTRRTVEERVFTDIFQQNIERG